MTRLRFDGNRSIFLEISPFLLSLSPLYVVIFVCFGNLFNECIKAWGQTLHLFGSIEE